MATTSSTAPAGVWTSDVAMTWLRALGVPHERGVLLVRGPQMPRTADRVIRVTPSPGARSGRSGGEEIGRGESWKGLQLAFRGRQRDKSDQDAEHIAAATHARIVAAATPVWLPAGTGRVRLVGLSWPAGGPAPLGPVPDDAERHLWVCTYIAHVIEHC